jgi:hypothetical protein
VQALLAPNYRWLDQQQRSKKDRFLNAPSSAKKGGSTAQKVVIWVDNIYGLFV